MSSIGSGQQRFRQENFNAGKFHAPGVAVFVTNFEDAVSVGPMRTSGYTVVNTLTKLPSGTAQNLPGRRLISVYNNGNDPVYVGPSGITDLTGYPIASGKEFAIEASYYLDVFAIAASGKSVNVRIIEVA